MLHQVSWRAGGKCLVILGQLGHEVVGRGACAFVGMLVAIGHPAAASQRLLSVSVASAGCLQLVAVTPPFIAGSLKSAMAASVLVPLKLPLVTVISTDLANFLRGRGAEVRGINRAWGQVSGARRAWGIAVELGVARLSDVPAAETVEALPAGTEVAMADTHAKSESVMLRGSQEPATRVAHVASVAFGGLSSPAVRRLVAGRSVMAVHD